MPILRRSSLEIFAWEVSAGAQIMVSTPPRLIAGSGKGKNGGAHSCHARAEQNPVFGLFELTQLVIIAP